MKPLNKYAYIKHINPSTWKSTTGLELEREDDHCKFAKAEVISVSEDIKEHISPGDIVVYRWLGAIKAGGDNKLVKLKYIYLKVDKDTRVSDNI